MKNIIYLLLATLLYTQPAQACEESVCVWNIFWLRLKSLKRIYRRNRMEYLEVLGNEKMVILATTKHTNDRYPDIGEYVIVEMDVISLNSDDGCIFSGAVTVSLTITLSMGSSKESTS